MILSLDNPDKGTIAIETPHKKVKRKIGSLGIFPRTYKCGGVKKQIKIMRLPDERCGNDFSFSLPLKKLKKGDNPIYIRVTQEDGHIAWTSPVYLIK